jgi:hypothetical protein
VSDVAQQALFAPYCGGVNREEDLDAALQILRTGRLQGRRPVQGMDGHPFVLSWSAASAPLETIVCQLRFAEHAEADAEFELCTYQLVCWLMDRSGAQHAEPDLPDAFWHWFLIERGDALEHA